ncbi:hypothetical protein C9374_014511 [Naegleria lovaniensis]|uniref:Glycosyltransferase n=1 Tax=Naegleria lovaniensis TaxID=51637 RepID=A0AA88KPY2_NAELO|nr:uncharacterized protein C9374_014511 [Naegleria lovaniensis]KAG2389111.1 hypothetical protein C9374_014511 [Naegleria lovaniensis]
MQTSSLVGPFSSGTMRNRPTSSFHHSQQDENPIQQNIYSTTSNTTTSSKYRSQHQTKPNRWILAIIIGIPILLLVLFYWEFSKTENVEWDDVKEDMHVPQQAVLSELSQEDSIRNRKRSKLAIITYAQSDAHMDWLKKEYFAHLEEMRQSRTIVYISVCENIRNNLDLSDFTNNENRDVIKISFSKSCHIPSLISNGMKFSKKLSEFMMVLDPGFSIYVNDELNAPHSQTIVKKRIDDLLGESDESKQLFREHVDYGLLVVNVIDSSETPSTTFNLHIPKERAKNRLWVSKLLPLYSQEQRKSISQFYEQWDQSNALYVPFSENYDRDTILNTPASHFFIFATTSPEDNNYNLKNDEIIDHVVEGLERHVSENSYQNSFNMIESRQVLSNLILSQIFDRYEHLKEKLNPPPIYFLPKPFVIEWKPSHNVLHESTELLHNGLSFATYCRIDEIESLNGLIKRLSDGDHLIVIFTANSPKQCMSTELQQFINSPKKARLDYKCIVVKKKDSIPINHFKNQALLLAKTKWIFMLDVQSRVSKNLNRDFTKVFIADSSSRPREKLEPLSQHSESLYWKSPIEHMKKYSNLAQFLELEKIVFIPPSFEQIEMEEELPTDFTSLKKVYQKRMLSVVDAQQVDFSNYFAVSSQGQKAYQVKPYYPFNSLFIAAVTHLPLYDEYSYQSLAVHHVHLTMRYFQYFVLPRHFVIGYVSESPRKRTKPKQPQFELVLKKMSGFYSNERINMVKKDQH